MGANHSISVSVVIPAYNAEQTIEQAIESVLGQTSAADEIIVVDDGSTDQTAAKVRSYEPRITYIRQDNAGANEARNTGIQQAASGWIALLDADDRWLPNKLELQRQLLTRNPHLVWAYGNYRIIRTGKPDRLAHPSAQIDRLLNKDGYFNNFLEAYANGIPVHTITMIIQKKALLKAGLFLPGQIINHDPDVALRLAYQYSGVGYCPELLAEHHFGRPTGITQQSKTLLDERKTFINRHLVLSRKYHADPLFEACARRLIMKWISNCREEGYRNQGLELLQTFKSLLPERFAREMRLRLKWPWTERLFTMYHQSKRRLRSTPNEDTE